MEVVGTLLFGNFVGEGNEPGVILVYHCLMCPSYLLTKLIMTCYDTYYDTSVTSVTCKFEG